MDCGPASLKSLLEGFRIPVSYGRLREACQTDVDGTSIDTLEEVANRLGLDAEQTMLPVDHLLLAEAKVFPALIVVTTPGGLTHFVILWRRVGGWLQLMDPAIGRHWVRAARFMEKVYAHRHRLPAPAWREWAGGEGHRALLAERLSNLGVRDGARLIDGAVADAGWHGIATLDAAIRLTQSLVDSGAISTRRSARTLNAFLETPDRIPESAYAVKPIEAGSDGTEMIAWKGAVFIHVSGKKSEGAARDLPPELRAALSERPAPAAAMLFSMVRESGLLSPPLLLIAMVASAAGVLLEGLLFRGMFDLARELGTAGQRLAAFGAILALLAVLLFLEFPQVTGLLRLGRQVEMRMRLRFLSKLPLLSDRYFQSRPKSDMAERSHSLQMVRHLPEFCARILKSLFALLFTSAGIVWLDPGALVPVIAYVGASFAAPIAARPSLLEKDMRLRTHLGALGRYYLDALLGLFAVRAHGAERSIRAAHRELLNEWARAALQLQRSAVTLEGVQMLLGYGLGALVIIDHFSRHAEAGTGLLFVYWVLSLPTLAQTLVQAAWQYPGFRNVTLRLIEPLGAIEEPRASELEFTTDSPGMAIRMEGVSVRAGGNTILEGLDIEIAPGSHVAIIGPSGAGKSSFAGLLLGWHRPASGTIQADGVALEGGASSRLRRQIAWVDPEVQLWNSSCIDNLSYGADPDEIPEIGTAVERAELMDVVSRLRDGLQTPLGEGGAALSGGQGQRVRLGRAMIRRRARLVILDEPFRGLDRERRLRLTERIREHWRNSTILCITHDVRSTLDFDRVLLIEGGRLVEDGTPEALRARAGARFRALLEAEDAVAEGLWSQSGWRHVRIDSGEFEEIA
jgi:ATP-binding cassette subfamily B protein